MSFTRKNITVAIVAVLMLSAIAVLILPRIIAETKNKNVEIAMPYSSAVRVSRWYGYSPQDFFDRLKSAGVTTIILEEETPRTLEDESGILFFSKSEYVRLNLLEIISEGSLVKPISFVFPSGNDMVAYYIKEILIKNYGFSDARIQKAGNRIFLYTVGKTKFPKEEMIMADSPLGFSVNKIKDIAAIGFRLAIAPSSSDINYIYNSISAVSGAYSSLPVKKESAPFIYPVAVLPPVLYEKTSDASSAVLPTGSSGISDVSLTREDVISKFYYVDMEFSDGVGVKEYFGPFYSVKGHRIPSQEMKRFSYLAGRQDIKRYLRAVRERGVRFVVIEPEVELSIDENINRIKLLARSLKKIGLHPSSPATPIASLYPASPYHPEPPSLIFIRKLFSFIAAFLVPPVLIYRFRRWIDISAQSTHHKTSDLPVSHRPLLNATIRFLRANLLVLLASIFVASFVSSPEFASGSFEMPVGIKFLLGGSFIVAVLGAIYTPEEIKNFALSPIRLWHFVVGVVAVYAFVVMLARSGNDGGGFVLSWELKLREFLENLFVLARPRWKEILVGQPFLYLAFRYNKKFLLIFASVAVVSVINTFLHIHTPLGISIYRSVSGVVVGLLGGFILSALIRFLAKKSGHRIFNYEK